MQNMRRSYEVNVRSGAHSLNENYLTFTLDVVGKKRVPKRTSIRTYQKGYFLLCSVKKRYAEGQN